MEDNETNIGLVGQTIKDLLPTVNEGFNWEIVKRRYDSDPVGTAMSLYFTEELGKDPEEQVHLGIADGPEIVVLDAVDEEWDHIGSVVTYQDYGMKILDPDHPMDPTTARYQHAGVAIHPTGDESRERVWMVVSNVLEIILESVIHAQKTQAEAERSEG
jgi:hypothetical protein